MPVFLWEMSPFVSLAPGCSWAGRGTEGSARWDDYALAKQNGGRRRAAAEPHFRMRKVARTVRSVTRGRQCDLLDVGCGPATLAQLMPAGGALPRHRHRYPGARVEPDRDRHHRGADRLRRQDV